MHTKNLMFTIQKMNYGLIGIGIAFVLGLFLVLFMVFMANNQAIKSVVREDERQYHGAVPEGYDESYFRQTGITKKIIGGEIDS